MIKSHILLIIALSGACMGLTPVERAIVLHAKANIEAAQAEQKHSKDLGDWAIQSNQEAWDYAATTTAAAKQTGKEINTAHQHEKDQAAYIGKMEPVYKAVTRWWSLGAFVWGVQQLIKHLIILAIFATALLLVFWGLTFAFPFLLPVFGIVIGVLHKILSFILGHIEARLKK